MTQEIKSNILETRYIIIAVPKILAICWYYISRIDQKKGTIKGTSAKVK